MFFVYLNIQFTSFHEHARPHQHVGCSSTIISTYHSFWPSAKCCSSLMSLSIFFQGEHWLYQRIWQSVSVETHRSFQWVLSVNLVSDLLSRSNKIALTDNLDGLYRKEFNWIFHYFNCWRERVRKECGMLLCKEYRNDRSSHHCFKNWTRWELDPDSKKAEHWHRKSIELSSCSSDHSPNYIVQLSWQLNIQRQAWWDLPCRITWQWTISPSWNKTGSSTYTRLFVNLSQVPCR